MRVNFERISSILLTVSAVTIAGAVVYRTFKANTTDVHSLGGGGAPVAVADSDWRAAIRLGAPETGNQAAPVTIVEFTDLECPACRGFQGVLDSFARKNSSKVRVLYIPFPLTYHRFAIHAARGAECASTAGALSSWISTVFSKQDSIGLKSWGSYAREAGLPDTARIAECTRSSAPVERIQQSIALGSRVGIEGTPGLVVEGLRLRSVPSEQLLQQLTDSIVRARR
jgi:protein-disulfide isomerase